MRNRAIATSTRAFGVRGRGEPSRGVSWIASCAAALTIGAPGAAKPPPKSGEADPGDHDPSSVFELSVRGECPGEISLVATGATPGGLVGFAYGFAEGATAVPPCPGVFVDIAGAVLAGTDIADKGGTASISGFVPEAACGKVFVQAVDVRTCLTSNTAVIGMETIHIHRIEGGLGLSAGYCLLEAEGECTAGGIASGDTLCLACEGQQTNCSRYNGKQVIVVLYRDADCKERICSFQALGTSADCGDCPTGSKTYTLCD